MQILVINVKINSIHKLTLELNQLMLVHATNHLFG